MSEKKPHIVVVASFMMDLSTKVRRIPLRGETVIGDEFQSGAGGKGSNQAVCAKRLGLDVTVIVKIGSDVFGNEALENFKKEGFDTSFIYIDGDHPTGVAPIFVEDTGENIIAIVPGANSFLTPDDVDNARDRMKNADVLLTNFEIPIETARYALKTAKEYSMTTILNPAPAPQKPVDKELFRFVDVLTPNETEARGILGKLDSDISMQEIGKELLSLGIKRVVLTLGENGALYISEYEQTHIPALKVNTIDATGAGDAFNGALAVAISEGTCMKDAILFANKVAAISTTRFGTARAMPYRDELK
jgi:ribokinase